jgi:hypothetical protein
MCAAAFFGSSIPLEWVIRAVNPTWMSGAIAYGTCGPTITFILQCKILPPGVVPQWFLTTVVTGCAGSQSNLSTTVGSNTCSPFHFTFNPTMPAGCCPGGGLVSYAAVITA